MLSAPAKIRHLRRLFYHALWPSCRKLAGMQSEPLRFFFIVQGEGRGHLTQAIALKEILEGAGARVVEVWVGTNTQRTIPPFFGERMRPAKLQTFAAPNFVRSADDKGILLGRSLWRESWRARHYFREMKRLHRAVVSSSAHKVVNFYEPLPALGNLLGLPALPVPVYAVAHQYIYLHPQWRFPPIARWQSAALRFFTSMARRGAAKTLALSFYPLFDPPHFADTAQRPAGGLMLVPPLLRNEAMSPAPALPPAFPSLPFILCYLLNAGYRKEIEEWHARHPDTLLHCFTDDPAISGSLKVDDTLWLHSLNDTLFLTLLKNCSGVATTAGFETIAEALYHQKPIFMVPPPGHFEQLCNALDTARLGAAVHGADFRSMPEIIPTGNFDYAGYRAWLQSAPSVVTRLLMS